MKIKRSPKKNPSTNAGIAAFILQLTSCPADELPSHLLPVLKSGWTWPRTDLQHWINPLDRLDGILEGVINDYDLGSMEHCQTNAFTPRTRELLAAILGFEKLLLENSTNKKIFNSYDRINDLLHTTDVDILLAALRLGLRPAQQYSSSGASQGSFGISEKRLLNLAQGWGTREYGLDMVDLAAPTLEIPAGLEEVEWQFYKKATPGAVGSEPLTEKKDKGKEVDSMDVEDEKTTTGETSAASSMTTPAPKPRATFAAGALLATPIPSTPFSTNSAATPSNPPVEGLTNVLLGNVRLSPKSAVDILVDAIETYGIPEPERLNLLQKIRIGKALGSAEERRALLVVRLLAIAVFAHTSTESSAQTKLFLYEPELIPQLAELVHPDRDVAIEVQVAAFYALDALARFKGKLSEVASSLNASVSHGIMMYVIRRTVADLESDNPVSTPDFLDALFNILTYFQTAQNVGNSIVGAGIVSVLVDFVKNQRRERVSVVTKAIVFLDGLMYGYSSAFTMFVTAGGLAVFVERVKDEIEICVAAHSEVSSTSKETIDAPTGLLSFEQAALLKALLRAIQRLMQTAGTTEGMRNLIDSTLLTSVKTMIQNRAIFGPQIFGLAINITATFVHNEPTCLTTIQEAKVPEALYDALEEYIPASIDVLQAIPNAVGALCLNPAGLAQFNSRSIISKYFEIFSSPTHVRVLSERDNGNMIGTSIDELVRHHPSLKDPVLSAVYNSLVTIREHGRAFVPTTKAGDDQGFALEVVIESAAGAEAQAGASDVDMIDASSASAPVAVGEVKDEDIMNGVDVMGRFLEGLFQNISHCKDFIKLEPFSVLLDLLALPCAPSTTPGTASFASIAAVFRVFCEAKPTEVATAIMKHVKLYLDKTKEMWSPFSAESRLVPLITPSVENLAVANQKFRDLSALLTFVSLLSDIYSNFTYAHGKTATTILVVLATPNELEGFQHLGELFQVSLWENILLNFVKKKESEATTPATAEPSAGASAAVAGEVAVPMVTGSEVTPISATTKAPSTPTSRNTKAIQDVVSSLAPNVISLFQATIKLLLHRRSTEVAHRKAASEVAASIASIMVEGLRWPESPDLATNLSYATAMILAVSGLLFEDRSNPPAAQMLLLIAFEKAGGITALTSTCEHLIANSIDLIKESEDLSVGIPVVQNMAGLKAVLALFKRLASHQSILESPQTGLLLNREKDKNSPEYFDPHAFIIKLRAAILPAIAGIWDVPWIRRAPTTLVRTLVATLVSVLRAEGETSTEPSILASGIPQFPSAVLAHPAGLGGLGAIVERAAGGPAVLDQARVSQLMDMGFPRTAVEAALTRCRNSVGIATEYLLQHPDVVGAARIAEAEAASRALAAAAAGTPEAQPGPVAAPPAAVDAAVPPPAADEAVPVEGANPPAPAVEADVEMADAPAPVPADDPPPLVESTAEAHKARDAANVEVKAALEAARKAFEPTFLPRAMSLAEQYPDLVFDIKRVFNYLGGGGDKSAPDLKPLLDGLFVESASSAGGVPAGEDTVAIRLRVIALLAADPTYRQTIEASREELMKVLVSFQKIYAKDFALPATTIPKWLSPMMLVVDALLSLSEVPAPTTILAADAEIPSPDFVGQGPAWTLERQAFFELAMSILLRKVTGREVFISTLRLLLVLTHDHDLAVLFVKQDGLRSLFAAFDEERPETEGCRSYVTMILRHVIEDKATLLPMMEREIEAWFAPPKSRVADVTGFLRGASSIAFRNVPLFIEATKATCKLVQADATGHYHVGVLREPQPTPKPTEATSAIKSPLDTTEGAPATTSTEETAAPAKTVKPSLPPTPTTETTIHFLMTAIMEKSKLALAPSTVKASVPLPVVGGVEPAPAAPLPVVAASTLSTTTPGTPPKTPGSPSAEVPLGDFYQTAFSMNSLAELISSYPSSKASFLSFSTRQDKEPSTTHHKKSSFLHFLLNDLLHTGTIVPLSDFDFQRRSSISTCATLVIVALCHDPDSTASPTKEPSPELSVVLKTVFDAIAKAFKEVTTSSEPTDVRYSRLLALSDLCYRLLTSRPYPSISRPRDDTSMQLAKMMLEKNFAVILTNALADVDLNFPSVNNLINSILRPLEQLTKVVTKVGRAKGSVAPAGRPDDETESDASSFDEGEEMDADTEEEEAPDLYRNSALGMYDGELEPGHHEDAYMTDDSGAEYDEEDDMMDLEDGVIPDSDLSDVSDEEDEEAHRAFHEHEHEHEDMSDDDDDEDDEDGDSEDDSTGDDDDDELLELDEDGGDQEILIGEDDAEDQDGVWADDGEEDEEGNEEEGGPVAVGGGFFDQGGNGGPMIGGEDADSEESEDEEEMYFEGALELDMEMTEQLAAQDARHGGGFGWDSIGNGETGAGRRNRMIADDMMQLSDATVFGRPRPAAGTPNTATHPLLSEAPPLDSRSGEAPSTRRQRGAGPSRGTPEYTAWVESIEAMIGVGGVEALEELLHSHGLSHLSGTDQIRVQVGPGPNGGPAMFIDPSPAIANAQAQAQAQATPRSRVRPATTSTRGGADRINVINSYLPVATVQRWQEEIRITQGSVLPAERVARLVNHVINVLHPAARAIAAETKKQAEEATRLEEEKRSKAPEAQKTVAAQPMDTTEATEAPVPASTSAEQAPVVPAETPVASASANAMDDGVSEVMNLARSLAAALAPPPPPAVPVDAMPAAAEGVPSSEGNHEEDESHGMDEDEDEDDDDEGDGEDRDEHENAEAGGSGAGGARVVISIHGQDVDITDTGIDPTFLEALPDDMREEVLNQHFRESRSAGPPPAVPSQINSEFLDALPPDLRAEVLRQEAAEQRREQAATRAAAGGAANAAPDEAGGPVDIDPASFLASLNPQLRNAVLLDQDDGFLASLPANLLAEANLIRDQAAAERRARRALLSPPVEGVALVVAPKKPAHREAIQLLEKSGLATLVRLLFFPQPLRKNSLQKVLVNLCENSRTRMELINLLLTILQDGTRDVSAVDKSFSQMSLRATKSLATKETPRRKGALETPGGPLPHFPGESVPNLIAQRCLEALMFLCQSNEQASLFFLTEQEIVLGLGRRSAKKAKGKEKAVPSTAYPIVVLLGLLDRPALLKTQSMMDSLTQLLSLITKPLSLLQKKPTATESSLSESTPAVVPAPVAAPGDLPAISAESATPAGPALTEAPAATPSTSAAPDAPKEEKETPKETQPLDVLLKDPPQISPTVLRLVVNILDAGECSSKTFQQTLVLIQNLSFLSEARDIISEELKVRAQALSKLLIPDLDELLRVIEDPDAIRGVTLAKFSPASSLQAKLLRILKTIDWIHSSLKKAASSAAGVTDPIEVGKISAEEDRVRLIYESFAFDGLWQRLGACLAGVEERPDLLYIATVLLPLIESLMVVSKYVGAKRAPHEVQSPVETTSTAMALTSPKPEPSTMESIFLTFTDDHRKILNTMVRNNPSLMSGSFAILVHNPKVLEFDNKRSYFFSRLHDRSQRQRGHYGTLQVNVRRQYVFEDSFHNLQRRTGDEIKNGKLSVKFYDEEGVDAGGVTREWFSVLARQMFNPGYALFQPQAADALTYQPNKSSSINPEHLSFFKFVGRIIGKALHDQRILEAYFSRSVYKHMLGKPVTHRDLESIDPEYHKSLVWMLDNDIDGVLDLTFSVERDDFGVTEVVDLIPDGRNIAVTNENKAEYVRLIADQRLSIDIKDQISALIQGLYEIIPKDLLQIFSEKELELLISGLPEIDVDEWRANTDLHNFSSTDPIIGYFWRAVRSFTLEERAKLLQFVSGSSRVPLEGFGALQGMTGVQKFSITSAGATTALPTAHTCFNQLDLPNSYASYEALRKALLMAITEGAGSFGFQ